MPRLVYVVIASGRELAAEWKALALASREVS
jgi:hypothetical protein